MWKAQLILIAVRVVMCLIALGLGIWYLSSSIGGAALTYTSADNFMNAIGVENGDIATANGCFMCRYIADLFSVIGDAAERFWGVMVDSLWIIMVLGLGLYILIHSIKHIFNAAKQTANLDGKETGIDLKSWFEPISKQVLRLMVVGAVMGMLGLGGVTAMKTVSQITITPVLYVGAELGMAATGVSNAAQCGALTPTKKQDGKSDVLNPILQPFMCVMGNINSVMLAGAAGGFAMMNYAWLGMGGGAFTWLAGLTLVLMFLIIGFDLFFQILSVVFKLVFLIIFLPLLLAAYAFEPVWAKASGLMGKAVGTLASSAVRLVAITLKVLIVFATVSYTADTFMPGPADGYSAIFPPLLSGAPENPDAKTQSVMNVFSDCERVALSGGEMDKDKFTTCFTARKAEVERKYPGAFDFLGDGFDFLLMMMCLFFLYYYAISPKVDKMLPAGAVKMPIPGEDVSLSGKEEFDYGAWIHDLGQKIWHVPEQITKKATAKMGKKDS